MRAQPGAEEPRHWLLNQALDYVGRTCQGEPGRTLTLCWYGVVGQALDLGFRLYGVLRTCTPLLSPPNLTIPQSPQTTIWRCLSRGVRACDRLHMDVVNADENGSRRMRKNVRHIEASYQRLRSRRVRSSSLRRFYCRDMNQHNLVHH